MKKYFLTLLVFILFSCKKNSQTSSLSQSEHITSVSNKISNNDEAIQIIKNFYLESYTDIFPPNTDKIRRKYVSNKLLNKIHELSSDAENLILDYDPFIKGQDYNASSIASTLQIQALNDHNDYRVSFLLFGNKNEQKTNVDLSIIMHNGTYLINNILNDVLLNSENINKLPANKISIVGEGSSIIITKNNHKKILKNLNINEASLSTTLKTINNNEVCLIYENNASRIKSTEIYTLTLKEDQLYLVSKEVLKLGDLGIENRTYLYDKLISDKIDYEELSNLDYNEENSFTKYPIKNTIYKNSKIVEVKEYKNISPEDYYINKISENY